MMKEMECLIQFIIVCTSFLLSAEKAFRQKNPQEVHRHAFVFVLMVNNPDYTKMRSHIHMKLANNLATGHNVML